MKALLMRPKVGDPALYFGLVFARANRPRNPDALGRLDGLNRLFGDLERLLDRLSRTHDNDEFLATLKNETG